MGARRLLFAVIVTVGCDTLPVVQNGVCGNKVVDATEDCDTFATAPGALCRPPGSSGECRYACGPQTSGTVAVCPHGMGCGTDGTCRTPDGTYGAATQPIAGLFGDIRVGDIDGDKRADVVGIEAGELAASFFDGTLTSIINVRTPSRSNGVIDPILMDISGDGRADLVINAGNGSLVELGSATRAFVPLAFPNTHVSGIDDASILVIGAPPPVPGQTLFVMGTYGTISGIASLDVAGKGSLFAPLPSSPKNLAGPPAIAHLVENFTVSPCDEIAISFVGSGEVDVYTACSDGGSGYVFNTYDGVTKKPTAVTLAGATVVRGPLLLDVNVDGHLDFVVGASRCTGCDEVDVAYGVGDGTFHSNASTIPATGGDNTFSVYSLVPGPLPLALGDLDGDGIVDQVTATDVYLTRTSGPALKVAHNHAAPWTEAVIADFNRDGIADVAAGSSSSPNVAFFIGTGAGTLDPFIVESAPVAHFSIGDFDGDLVDDLALAEIAAPTDPLGDSVSILFGNAAGAPSPPISMGHFASVRQTTFGRFRDIFGVVSGTEALLTTSVMGPETDFGAFSGSGDRVLRSPLAMATFSTDGTIVSAIPSRYAFGHFSKPDGPVDVAALDSQNFPVPASPLHRAWILPTDGQGRFIAAKAHACDVPAPDGVDYGSAGVAAIDLDGSGMDALVMLGPSSADAVHGAVCLARLVAGPTTDPIARFAFGVPAMTDARVVHAEAVDPTQPVAPSGRLLVGDVDGDGRPDLIAQASMDGTPSIVVFFNDHSGQLGSPTLVPNPNGYAAVDMVLLDTGASTPSIAILTDEGVSLVGAPGRVVATPVSAFHVAGGRRIAAGDVDGDGVTDLVVTGDGGTIVYRGRPVRP